MNQLSDRQRLTANVARSFAWFSLVVAATAAVVWVNALYDLFVGEWTRLGIVAFCAACLTLTAYMLVRTAVRPIT